MLRIKYPLLGLMILLGALMALNTAAQQPRDGEGAFAPIGAGYSDTYAGWLTPLITTAPADAEIRIVVNAAAYSYDAFVITPEERADLTAEAQIRVDEMQAECVALLTGTQSCVTLLSPLFIRADALDAGALTVYDGAVDAIFFLGGDQAIAMQILKDTPVEVRMGENHTAGAIIVGTSAGNAVQSRVMIAGYINDYGPEDGLVEGSVEVWNNDLNRGLDFGLTNAVLDQHFFQRTRLARLLNVLAQPDVPSIGIGVDAYTGVFVNNRVTVEDTFGLYTAAILDAASYNAAANAQFVGGILSIHDVLVHLLAPGTSSY
ncbi:MAG: Type 1 glutamine amidotransferase-like domain-containing protein, partial [Armatimonadetes bacterium]|nr:Type 1 glutamine amidotransferase-like domain-containing protein [Anaerolineae bacterium]